MDKVREALEAVNRYINDGSPLPPAGDPYYEVDRLVNEALSALTRPQPEAREEDMAALQWREAYLRQCSDSAFLTQKIKDLEAEREHWCEPLRAEIAALSRLAARGPQSEAREDIEALRELVKITGDMSGAVIPFGLWIRARDAISRLAAKEEKR